MIGAFVLHLPTMTDYNENKIDLEDRERSTPDGCDPQLATSAEADIPAGSETDPPILPKITK